VLRINVHTVVDRHLARGARSGTVKLLGDFLFPKGAIVNVFDSKVRTTVRQSFLLNDAQSTSLSIVEQIYFPLVVIHRVLQEEKLETLEQ